jgi:hypothetical protein
MDKATDSLEHMNHAAHAGEHGQEQHSRISTYIGISMAVLGVILAFASAKVSGERTELVKSMVEQQDAHMRYVTQDIKHRIAVISLYQLRGTAAVLPGRSRNADRNSQSPDAEAMVNIANTIQRYLKESKAAGVWSDAFDPVIRAHVEGQDKYELGLLASEIGIVMASVALLLRRKMIWYMALALGVISIGIIIATYARTAPTVHESEKKIEEYARAYHELRAADKTTQAEEALIKEVLAAYGKP